MRAIDQHDPHVLPTNQRPLWLPGSSVEISPVLRVLQAEAELVAKLHAVGSA